MYGVLVGFRRVWRLLCNSRSWRIIVFYVWYVVGFGYGVDGYEYVGCVEWINVKEKEMM